jgi:hypothetical protein
LPRIRTMSEYQYYEFQALDRPLTEREREELRSVSSRATITATRFTNHYEWGDFKGDPAVWMERYFDAFVYVANWGTHELSLRLPRRLLDLETAKRYCCSQEASARSAGDFVILELLSQEEGGDDGWDDGSGWLSSLIPLRDDLANGDFRALYLGWLLSVQSRELDDEATEPPVPAGLGELTGPLQALVDFLRIDGNLLVVAAERSPALEASSADQGIKEWITALPEAAKTDWLVRLAGGQEVHLRMELLRRFREAHPAKPQVSVEAPRTVGDLLAAADRIAEERRRKEAERAAAERARREKEEREARERYLNDLAQREVATWSLIDRLIATKQPSRYDEAVKLLCDLRELALARGRRDELDAGLRRLCEEHSRKPSFLERLRRAGLV